MTRRLLDRPWRAAAFVGAGVDEVLGRWGRPARASWGRRSGSSGWPRARTRGPDAPPGSGAAFREATGAPPLPGGGGLRRRGAGGALPARGGERPGRPVRAVADPLAVRTLFGGFRLDPATGLQVGHEVLTRGRRGWRASSSPPARPSGAPPAAPVTPGRRERGCAGGRGGEPRVPAGLGVGRGGGRLGPAGAVWPVPRLVGLAPVYQPSRRPASPRWWRHPPAPMGGPGARAGEPSDHT